MAQPGREAGTGKFVAVVSLDADIAKFMKGIDSAAGKMATAGASFASSTTKMIAAAGMLAGGLAVKEMIGGGLRYNAMMEAGRDRVAATLRLYNHLSPEVDATASAAAKFAGNLREAEEVQRRLVKIADESPGSYEQVDRMFQSMLPSARAITGDMEKIMDLTTKTTLFAGVTGDFDLAGSQMGMMLGGGAGQEMQMWRLLKPTMQGLLEADKKLKKGAKASDVTMAFNQALTPAERLEYVMKSLDSLGPEVAEHFGKSWEGASAAALSRWRELQGAITGGAFKAAKAALVSATSGEGILASQGKGYGKLKEAANYLGHRVEGVSTKLFGAMVKGAEYLADNWQPIVKGMERAFHTGITAAKMMLAAKLAQAAGGAAYTIGKGAFDMGAKLPELASHIMKLGAAGVAALPIFLLLAAAAAGFAIVFGGVAAWFVENWDMIIAALASGAITIAPIFDVIDLLWAKMVAMGGAFMGTTDVAGGVQAVINGVANALTWLMGVMSGMIRAAGWVAGAIGTVVNAFNLIIVGFQTVILGFMKGMRWLVDTVNEWINSEALASASAGATKRIDDMEASREKRLESINFDTTKKFFDAADAFDAAAVDGEGVTAGMRKDLEGKLAKLGTDAGGGMAKAKGKSVNIHNMNVYNDLRDHDPDRIMGTFVQKLEDVTMRPTQAVTLDDNGA